MIKAKKKEANKEASGNAPNKKHSDTDESAIGKPASTKTSIHALENDSKKPTAVPTALDMWVPPKKRRRIHAKEDEETYPVQPNVIHIVTKPRTHVNHTYRDFSSVPLPDGTTKIEIPQDISQMSFHLKVYHLLSTKVKLSDSSIEWCTHGRALRIIHADGLEYRLPPYFGHNRLSKFRKQLVDHGFKLITEGRDSGCYYSEVRTPILILLKGHHSARDVSYKHSLNVFYLSTNSFCYADYHTSRSMHHNPWKGGSYNPIQKTNLTFTKSLSCFRCQTIRQINWKRLGQRWLNVGFI